MKTLGKHWLSFHQCCDDKCPVHAVQVTSIQSQEHSCTATLTRVKEHKKEYTPNATYLMKSSAIKYDNVIDNASVENLYVETSSFEKDSGNVGESVPSFLCTWLRKNCDLNKFPYYKRALSVLKVAECEKFPGAYSEFATNEIWKIHRYTGEAQKLTNGVSPLTRSCSQERCSTDIINELRKDIPAVDITDLKIKYAFLFNPEYIFRPRGAITNTGYADVWSSDNVIYTTTDKNLLSYSSVAVGYSHNTQYMEVGAHDGRYDQVVSPHDVPKDSSPSTPSLQHPHQTSNSRIPYTPEQTVRWIYTPTRSVEFTGRPYHQPHATHGHSSSVSLSPTLSNLSGSPFPYQHRNLSPYQPRQPQHASIICRSRDPRLKNRSSDSPYKPEYNSSHSLQQQNLRQANENPSKPRSFRHCLDETRRCHNINTKCSPVGHIHSSDDADSISLHAELEEEDPLYSINYMENTASSCSPRCYGRSGSPDSEIFYRPAEQNTLPYSDVTVDIFNDKPKHRHENRCRSRRPYMIYKDKYRQDEISHRFLRSPVRELRLADSRSANFNQLLGHKRHGLRRTERTRRGRSRQRCEYRERRSESRRRRKEDKRRHRRESLKTERTNASYKRPESSKYTRTRFRYSKPSSVELLERHRSLLSQRAEKRRSDYLHEKRRENRTSSRSTKSSDVSWRRH